MDGAGVTVRAAAAGEAERAAAVLASAFADDPIFGYILDGRSDIEARIYHLFHDAIRAEQRKSTHLVELVESQHAVALWHEVDGWEMSPFDLARSLPSAVKAFGTRLPRALRVVTSAEKVHPSEPHRHLAYIGTHKDHNGKGFGGALLSSMLERCDREGIATYLESTNPANDGWYARFGYESCGRVPLPAGAPVITAMWRDAR